MLFAGFKLDELNMVSGLKLSKGSFSAMENGKQQISVYQLYRISKALNVSISSLLDEEKVHDTAIPKEDINKINEA
jgi:transcriptional regulator with XRE-family HTH domain